MPLPSSIATISQLPFDHKRDLYLDLVPAEILDQFQLSPFLVDRQGRQLLTIKDSPKSSSVELFLYHKYGFQDPIVYCHLTDTLNGQIHVLLYIMNDPNSERYDVDRMPDGTPTKFGTHVRNIPAEEQAFAAGYLPGQLRRGLNLLSEAKDSFERFIANLGHTIYFVNPLYYHNAVIFEKYGFAYQAGRKRMERIHQGFTPGGEFVSLLDNSAFRKQGAQNQIRLRSWAIHDGIMGESFDGVTMYKTIGAHAGINTAPNTGW